MAAVTTLPAAFVANTVLTAAEMNALRGAFRTLQVVSTTKTDTFTTTSTSFTDITGMSVSITPSSSSSQILVIATVSGSQMVGTNDNYVRLIRGSTAIAVGTSVSSRTPVTFQLMSGNANWLETSSIIFLDSPATTLATTYKLDARVGSNTMYINRSQTDTDSAGFPRSASTITVMEISA